MHRGQYKTSQAHAQAPGGDKNFRFDLKTAGRFIRPAAQCIKSFVSLSRTASALEHDLAGFPAEVCAVFQYGPPIDVDVDDAARFGVRLLFIDP